MEIPNKGNASTERTCGKALFLLLERENRGSARHLRSNDHNWTPDYWHRNFDWTNESDSPKADFFDIDSASGIMSVFELSQLSGWRTNFDESKSFRNEITLRQDEICDLSLYQQQCVSSYNAIGRFSLLTPNLDIKFFVSMWYKTARSSTVNPLAEKNTFGPNEVDFHELKPIESLQCHPWLRKKGKNEWNPTARAVFFAKSCNKRLADQTVSHSELIKN